MSIKHENHNGLLGRLVNIIIYSAFVFLVSAAYLSAVAGTTIPLLA